MTRDSVRQNRLAIRGDIAPERHPTVHLPTPRENRAITAAAKSDPDALPLTTQQLKAMVPIQIARARLSRRRKSNP